MSENQPIKTAVIFEWESKLMYQDSNGNIREVPNMDRLTKLEAVLQACEDVFQWVSNDANSPIINSFEIKKLYLAVKAARANENE